MSLPRGVRTLLVVVAVAAGIGGALGVGFVLGRRFPHGFMAWLRREQPVELATWEHLPDAPFRVFEAAVITVDQQTFVFGGFRNKAIQASPQVWMYGATTKAWTRKADLPVVFTHAPPVQVGDRLWFAGGFLGDSPGPATDKVWKYDWRADTWTPGPPLPALRGGGGLVYVAGKLHYFGGYTEDRNTNSSDHWVLDPSDTLHPQWIRATPLPIPRGHLSAAVVDGKIYAMGGCDGHDPYPSDLAAVHRYDPATDTWTQVASLPFPRSHFESGTMVRNGRIVIVGGRGRLTGMESVEDVTEYDPVADRWTALPPLPERRHSPIAFLVDGRIITGLGGRWTSDPDNNTMWSERADSAWKPGRPLPVPLGEVSAGLIGNRIYVLGAGAVWTLGLDIGTGRWDEPARHAARIGLGHHHPAEVWNNRLYLLGGLGAPGIVQIYDPATESWRLGPEMPFAAGASATAVIDSQIYVAGGIVGDTTTKLAARFNPAKSTWTPIAPMPLARNHAASGTDGKRLFVFGGRGPGSGAANTVANGFAEVQIYDPASNGWVVSGGGAGAPAPMPLGRGGAGKAVYVGGEFWVFGGETRDGPGATKNQVYSRVDVYNPVSNQWRAGPPLPTARHGIFPVAVGNRIYLLGGGTRAGASNSIVAEILDLTPGKALAAR